MYQILSKHIIDYASGLTLYIGKGYYDPYNGIHDDQYINTWYASGSNIIMSKRLVNCILNNKNKIDYWVVDDVAFGYYIKNYQPEINNIRKLMKEKDLKTPHKQSKMFQKQFY